MELEVLEALVTYMYQGTVSVPQNRLQSFLQTAEALKIKGIVDTGTDPPTLPSTTSSPPLPPAPCLPALPRPSLMQPIQVNKPSLHRNFNGPKQTIFSLLFF